MATLTITDEFIASGNAKWTQKSGVVLLLPHGFEGQGPDHSSMRIERWLQLCHEGALAVCQPSTPASYFHLLRTHAYVNWHRPVVIATPKSMLRNKLAVSQPSDFTQGRWQPAIGEQRIGEHRHQRAHARHAHNDRCGLLSGADKNNGACVTDIGRHFSGDRGLLGDNIFSGLQGISHSALLSFLA